MLKAAHAAIAVVILFVFAVILGAVPVAAQSVPCAPWEDMLRGLYDRYGELPAFVGNTATAVVTVTVNPKTGSYSVLAQATPETMCLVSVGENWREAPPSVRDAPAKPKGEDS